MVTIDKIGLSTLCNGTSGSSWQIITTFGVDASPGIRSRGYPFLNRSGKLINDLEKHPYKVEQIFCFRLGHNHDLVIGFIALLSDVVYPCSGVWWNIIFVG